MKIKNLAIGLLLVLGIACGGSNDNNQLQQEQQKGFAELGSLEEERQKCYNSPGASPEQVKEACDMTLDNLKHITESSSNPEACEKVFGAVMLSCLRQSIALKHDSQQAEKFGRRCGEAFKARIHAACGRFN